MKLLFSAILLSFLAACASKSTESAPPTSGAASGTTMHTHEHEHDDGTKHSHEHDDAHDHKPEDPK